MGMWGTGLSRRASVVCIIYVRTRQPYYSGWGVGGRGRGRRWASGATPIRGRLVCGVLLPCLTAGAWGRHDGRQGADLHPH